MRNDLVGSKEVSFSSPLSFGQMLTRLNQLPGGPWGEGDSHYYGDYLACAYKRKDVSGWVRIYFLRGKNFCKFKLWTSAAPPSNHGEWDALEHFVMSEMLASVEATGIVESDEID